MVIREQSRVQNAGTRQSLRSKYLLQASNRLPVAAKPQFTDDSASSIRPSDPWFFAQLRQNKGCRRGLRTLSVFGNDQFFANQQVQFALVQIAYQRIGVLLTI